MNTIKLTITKFSSLIMRIQQLEYTIRVNNVVFNPFMDTDTKRNDCILIE